MINSYIVKKQNIDELYSWAKKQDFWGRWMPEASGLYNQVFIRELYWSPAYKHYDKEYYNRFEWTQGHNNKIPKEVISTSDKYIKEYANHDCSIDEAIIIKVPGKLIVDRMNLNMGKIDGHFVDINNKLISFDPSINETGPGALLINREEFIKFLNDNEYSILWTILGEKRINSGHNIRDNWKGSLRINGVCMLSDKIIDEHTDVKFLSRE